MVLTSIDKKIIRHWCGKWDVRKWDKKARQDIRQLRKTKQTDAYGYFTVCVHEWAHGDTGEEAVKRFLTMAGLPATDNEDDIFEVMQLIEDYINAKTRLPGRYLVAVVDALDAADVRLYYREECLA